MLPAYYNIVSSMAIMAAVMVCQITVASGWTVRRLRLSRRPAVSARASQTLSIPFSLLPVRRYPLTVSLSTMPLARMHHRKRFSNGRSLQSTTAMQLSIRKAASSAASDTAAAAAAAAAALRSPIADNRTCAVVDETVDETKMDSEDEETFDDDECFDPSSEEDNNITASLPKGVLEDFFIVKEYTFQGGDAWKKLRLSSDSASSQRPERLQLTDTNVSLPVALCMVDPDEYPSLSRARKIIRKRRILLRPSTSTAFVLATSGDRVTVNDVIAIQVRMGNGSYKALEHLRPPFEVPVIYEDDHCAIVHKPAGVVTYRQGSGSGSGSPSSGLLTVRAALPFCLQPPSRGTFAAMRRPASVHRLDKPTSGLLVVAKTIPALQNLSEQFRHRVVKKTYMAIVNGIPPELKASSITSQKAKELGLDVDPSSSGIHTQWQIVDSPLDEKHAVTVWRAIQYAQSLHAADQYLTLVELKPLTGRFHQLRRHLAWEIGCPIVGDARYDRSTESAMKLRGNGLFLCATAIKLEHPYYNTAVGREQWDELQNENASDQQCAKDLLWLCPDSNRVMISASIELPDKFHKLLTREEERYEKLKDRDA